MILLAATAYFAYGIYPLLINDYNYFKSKNKKQHEKLRH